MCTKSKKNSNFARFINNNCPKEGKNFNFEHIKKNGET